MIPNSNDHSTNDKSFGPDIHFLILENYVNPDIVVINTYNILYLSFGTHYTLWTQIN